MNAMMHKSACVVVYRDDMRAVLLGERSDGIWVIAGGRAGEGESTLTAAWRVLREQFGITSLTLERVGRAVSFSGTTEIPVVYVCKNYLGAPEPIEFERILWMSVEGIPVLRDGIIEPISLEALKLSYERGMYKDGEVNI